MQPVLSTRLSIVVICNIAQLRAQAGFPDALAGRMRTLPENAIRSRLEKALPAATL
jgi:hypothetical protein